jgi:hypothetical protein
MKIPPEALAAVGLDPKQPQTAVAFFGALATLGPRLALADAVLEQLGERDPVRARGVLGAKLGRVADAEANAAKLKAENDAAMRERTWEAMVADGRVKLAQAFARKDGPIGTYGKPTVVRCYSPWAERQNAAYPELAAFEGWADSLPRGAHSPDTAPSASTVLADVADQRLHGHVLTPRDARLAKRAGLTEAELPLLSAIVQRHLRGATAVPTDPTIERGA